jgi:tellurite resistance protein TehA-like permease
MHVALPQRLIGTIREFHPGYYGLVMATGIISIDMWDHGFRLFSDFLFWCSIFAYAVLSSLYLLRASWFPDYSMRDLKDPRLTFSFFTFVAGTGVLGVHTVQSRWIGLAVGFWIVATFSWAGFTYTSLSCLFLGAKRPIEEAVTGSWLLAVVGAQSISVLSTLLAWNWLDGSELMLFFALCMWAWGVVTYFILIVIIVYRLTFFAVRPEELTPPYWIITGAAAISCVAGTTLIMVADSSPIVRPLRSFLLGTSILLWAWGTGWLPLLIMFGIWRHVHHGHTIRYEPTLWSIVFVLGMYSASTRNISEIFRMEILTYISVAFLWIAAAAWVLTAVNLVMSLRAR